MNRSIKIASKNGKGYDAIARVLRQSDAFTSVDWCQAFVLLKRMELFDCPCLDLRLIEVRE